jgi:hypothetical protein
VVDEADLGARGVGRVAAPDRLVGAPLLAGDDLGASARRRRPCREGAPTTASAGRCRDPPARCGRPAAAGRPRPCRAVDPDLDAVRRTRPDRAVPPRMTPWVSGLSVSGACSLCASTASHAVHRPARRCRRDTSTSTSGSSRQVTPMSENRLPVSGGLSSSGAGSPARRSPGSDPASTPASGTCSSAARTGRGSAPAGVVIVGSATRAEARAVSVRANVVARRTGSTPRGRDESWGRQVAAPRLPHHGVHVHCRPCRARAPGGRAGCVPLDT